MNARVLIIGNNCLSITGSNGRTLANILNSHGAENIAQFYIQPEYPDVDAASRYFRVTDREALKALVRGGHVGREVHPSVPDAVPSRSRNARPAKSPASMMMREIVWKSNRWRKSGSFDIWRAIQNAIR